MQNVFLNKMEEDFNITDHIIKLPEDGKTIEERTKNWSKSTYELKRVNYDITSIHDTSHLKKSNTPWYRRFENNRNHKRNNKR